MIQSRVTSRGRATIPRAVRIALGLKEGGRVAYDRGRPGDPDARRCGGRSVCDLYRMASAADAEAYGALKTGALLT